MKEIKEATGSFKLPQKDRNHFGCPGVGDGRVVQWCWVNFQCWSVLLIWIKVGQGPSALVVSAGRGCLDIFLSSIISYFLSLCLGDGPI